jgi:hypothetical protein
MRLGDLACLIRSKNAGPFTLTLDLLFEDVDAFDRVRRADVLTAEWVADTYQVAIEDVCIHVYEPGLAIKITIPRWVAAGDLGDVDVFGGQQYAPLVDLEVP